MLCVIRETTRVGRPRLRPRVSHLSIWVVMLFNAPCWRGAPYMASTWREARATMREQRCIRDGVWKCIVALASRLASVRRLWRTVMAQLGAAARITAPHRWSLLAAQEPPQSQLAIDVHEQVLLSNDLLPLILASLHPVEDGAAAAVCSQWARSWEAKQSRARALIIDFLRSARLGCRFARHIIYTVTSTALDTSTGSTRPSLTRRQCPSRTPHSTALRSSRGRMPPTLPRVSCRSTGARWRGSRRTRTTTLAWSSTTERSVAPTALRLSAGGSSTRLSTTARPGPQQASPRT